VAFASMLFMNDEQVAVMFPLNPLSKGVGNGLMLTVDGAVDMPTTDVVVVGVDEVCFAVAEAEPKGSSRRRRSSATGIPYP